MPLPEYTDFSTSLLSKGRKTYRAHPTTATLNRNSLAPPNLASSSFSLTARPILPRIPPSSICRYASPLSLALVSSIATERTPLLALVFGLRPSTQSQSATMRAESPSRGRQTGRPSLDQANPDALDAPPYIKVKASDYTTATVNVADIEWTVWTPLGAQVRGGGSSAQCAQAFRYAEPSGATAMSYRSL